MSETGTSNGKAPDPFEPWRGMRDGLLEAWAKALSDTVKSDAYAQTSGAVLDATLAASSPLRDLLGKTMRASFEQLNLPTREDFAGLAGRLENVETLLGEMDAKLNRIEKRLSGSRAKTAKPAAGRTKKKRAK